MKYVNKATIQSKWLTQIPYMLFRDLQMRLENYCTKNGVILINYHCQQGTPYKSILVKRRRELYACVGTLRRKGLTKRRRP